MRRPDRGNLVAKPINAEHMNEQGLEIVDDIIRDYHLHHKDILMVRSIEKNMKLFEVFRVRNKQMITLILAGARTLASEAGRFSMEDARKLLGYMSKRTQDKVLKELSENQWIVFDGFDYEMPVAVRSFISSMFLAFAKENLSMSEQIKTAVLLADLADEYHLGQQETESIKSMAFQELSLWNDHLERMLQKKSRRDILAIGKEIPGLCIVIKEAQRTLNDNHGRLSQQKYDAFFDVTSSILACAAQILAIALRFQRENQKGLGEYVTPVMIETALHEASNETLTNLLKSGFTAPKQVYQLREEMIEMKARVFLQNEKEDEQSMPPPQLVDLIEEEITFEPVQNPMVLFSQEVQVRMEKKEEELMDKLIFEGLDRFGVVMYRTGQMIRLTQGAQRETNADAAQKASFVLQVDDAYKQIPVGPVDEVTICHIRRRRYGTDK